MADAPDPIAIVNNSGYGLQAALEWVAIQARMDTLWRFHSRERLWHDPVTREPGFIDLILGSEQYDDVTTHFNIARLVIECKRADAHWVFPVPRRSPAPRASSIPILTFAPAASPSPFFGSVNSAPEAEMAENCVFSTRRGSAFEQTDRRTLEGWSTGLIAACHAVALQEREHIISAPLNSPPRRGLYVPVIVTTARLTVLTFDPAEVPLENGRIPPPPASESQEKPWVCFLKDLGYSSTVDTQSSNTGPRSFGFQQAVYVVQATAFSDFLRAFKRVSPV